MKTFKQLDFIRNIPWQLFKRVFTSSAANCFPLQNRVAALNQTTQSEPWNFLHTKLQWELFLKKISLKRLD